MTEKITWPSSARFAVSLLIFYIVWWTVWFLVDEERDGPFIILLGLMVTLPIAAAHFHTKTWLLKVMWLIPYAAGVFATNALGHYAALKLSGHQDDKTIVGLFLGIPILALASVLAALAAWISGDKKE
jgi:peptidoglycan/LPS O-acetylase OafA/YrhL